METIKHYSSFPATGVSLRQMVQFGERPSTGASVQSMTIRGFMVDMSFQERYFEHRNSCPKSSPFA